MNCLCCYFSSVQLFINHISYQGMSHRKQSSIKSKWDDSSTPISEEEQSKILEDLRVQALIQSKNTRYIFNIIFLALFVLMLILLGNSIVYPWQMEHQKHFENISNIVSFIGLYSVTGLGFIASSLIASVSNWFIII